MCVYLPGSAAVARTKIFKMASGSHFELFFIISDLTNTVMAIFSPSFKY